VHSPAGDLMLRVADTLLDDIERWFSAKEGELTRAGTCCKTSESPAEEGGVTLHLND
jgi:hypothetical protein